MKFERFQNIIEYNRRNQEEITKKVRELYSQMDMDYERDLLNMMLIVRPLFTKKQYIVLEIPFNDQEIGAICYKIDSFGYTFLNSALPKVNVNFALGHEIYHVFYQCEPFKQKIELYMNEHYYEHKDELSANLFAGVLLMPAPSFTSMFHKFEKEQNEDDSEITVVVKLMSYFEAPYMAVVIRCYELGLLPDGKVLKKLIKIGIDDIEKEFTRLWLDDEILKPTKRDDYPRLEQLVKDIGKKCEEEHILNDKVVSKVMANIRKIYNEIRG
jgi:Zn-dependent peptidase ImmA (M78 family)